MRRFFYFFGEKGRRGEMNDYLMHYGIKGMKWGVRRTPEQLGHVARTIGSAMKKGAAYIGASAKKASDNKSEKKKTAKNMTDDELAMLLLSSGSPSICCPQSALCMLVLLRSGICRMALKLPAPLRRSILSWVLCSVLVRFSTISRRQPSRRLRSK